MTRQSLKWVIKQLSAASAETETETETASVSSALTKLLEAPDNQLNQNFLSRESPAGKSLTIQSYGTPLLDARVSALWSFDTASQRALLEIRSSLDIASEIVERARYFTNLTFQKLKNGNHALAVENVEGCYKQYAQQARQIVEFIEKFENESKKSKGTGSN